MIHCSNCGRAFNPVLGACPACSTKVPGAATPEEVNAKKLAALMDPLPDPSEHASAEASAATTSTSKSRSPSGPKVSHAHHTAPSDPSSHEDIMSLLRSVGKKLVSTQRLAKRHGKWVWGGSVTIILLLLGVLVGEWRERWRHPQPDAIWIEVAGNAVRWTEDVPLRLTARTSPPLNVPREFRWRPADMIEGNGQSVTLKVPTSGRKIEYPVTVGLVAVDHLGDNCVVVEEKTIIIQPLPIWNEPPWFEENIHMQGSPEVRSGTSISLEALAKDKETEKLTYKWEVSSRLVEVEGSDRRVVLKFPRDFARRANVEVTVNLTVSDGTHNIAARPETLTVTPGGSVRILRPKPKSVPPKLAIPPIQTGPSPPPKVESPAMAVPQSSPNISEPGRS